MKNRIIILFLAFVLFVPLGFCADKIDYQNSELGVYIFKINTKKYAKKIKPLVVPKITTAKKVYDTNKYDLVVNAGFYDVKNEKSVSYVIIDDKLAADPTCHKELCKRLQKENRLDKVLSRGEFRVLENKRHKLVFDIARHGAPVKKGYKIKHQLQAGPIIYPDMDLEGEGFVVKENEKIKFQAADILKRRERTAIGLKGKWLYIVVFTKDKALDVYEMEEYLHNKLKLNKVLAFDGGLSTSVSYKNINIGSLGKYQRRVKSFLVIER